MIQNLYSREYPYLYRGIVESNDDPEGLGRCKVRVPSVHGTLDYSVDLLHWARPIVMNSVGGGRGSVNIPSKGDVVWVFFEGGNKRFPIYFGGTYSKGEVPIDKSTVDIYLENNARISYSRNENSILLSVGENRIKVDSSGISILGDTDITGDLKVSGNITAESLNLSGDAVIEGSMSTLGNASIGGSLTVSGDTVLNNLQINGSCNLQCSCDHDD